MLIRLTIAVSAIAAAGTASAAPVTGWTIVDSATGGATTKALAAADSDSPVVGTGADGSAAQIALYAPISGPADTAADVSLSVGQTMTLTGSATLEGNTSGMEQFRFGVFYEGSSPVDAKGWQGYIANNSSGSTGGALRAKDASYSGFHDLLFAATAASGSSVNLQTARDGGSFLPGTYDFSMSVTRLANSLAIDASLTRGTSFAQVWENAVVTDPDLLTFNFNRVGFLSANISADRITFSDVDVTTASVPAVTLEVLATGPDAGAMRLKNNSSAAVDIDYYEIASASGSLDVEGWSSLNDQSTVAPPAGWNEAGGVDQHLLAEANILGSTTVAPNGVLRLGRGVDPVGLRDLQFSVGLAGDRLIAGSVEYIGPGDFNGDGAIDASDLLLWRDEFDPQGVADADFDGDSDGADFLAWQRGLGSVPAVAAMAGVPEPGTFLLVLMASASLRRTARPRRQR
jgi:hypothetical protein